MGNEFRAGLVVPCANLAEKLTVRVDGAGPRYVDLFQDNTVLIGIYAELQISSTAGW
jgi:hypothetical protein